MLTFNLLDALFWGREVFGHGAAQFLDGLADFAAYGVVGLIGIFFSLDVIPAEFGFCLGGTEKVGSQFFIPVPFLSVAAFGRLLFFLFLTCILHLI